MSNLIVSSDLQCAEIKLEILKMVYHQVSQSGMSTKKVIEEVNDLWGCVSEIKNKGKEEETDVSSS